MNKVTITKEQFIEITGDIIIDEMGEKTNPLVLDVITIAYAKLFGKLFNEREENKKWN